MKKYFGGKQFDVNTMVFNFSEDEDEELLEGNVMMSQPQKPKQTQIISPLQRIAEERRNKPRKCFSLNTTTEGNNTNPIIIQSDGNQKESKENQEMELMEEEVDDDLIKKEKTKVKETKRVSRKPKQWKKVVPKKEAKPVKRKITKKKRVVKEIQSESSEESDSSQENSTDESSESSENDSSESSISEEKKERKEKKQRTKPKITINVDEQKRTFDKHRPRTRKQTKDHEFEDNLSSIDSIEDDEKLSFLTTDMIMEDEDSSEIEHCDRLSVDESDLNENVGQSRLNEHVTLPWKSNEEYVNLRYFSSKEHVTKYENLFKKGLVEDKEVLVVQCGFGKVALLALEYGAKRVVAIDDRDVWILLKQIVEMKRIKGITVYNKKVSDIDDLFDIIICDWMGINILYDSKINEMIESRRLLKRNGQIVPRIAKCYICGIGDMDFMEEKKDQWSSVYGYNMSSLMGNVSCTAYLDFIDVSKIITKKDFLFQVDIMTIENTKPQNYDFRLQLQREVALGGFCTFFETFWENDRGGKMSTAPGSKTYWKQCCYLLTHKMKSYKIDDIIEGKFRMYISQQTKRWAVKLQFDCEKRGFAGRVRFDF